MNAVIIEKHIISFIRRVTAGAEGVVIGLSGGVDSSTVAALCVRALGKEKVIGLILPERGVSKLQDVQDAEELARQLRIKTHIHPLNDILDVFVRTVPFVDSNKSALGNVKARIRMMLLYCYANACNYRVAGTGNKSELHVGYFTKYGDGGVDFLPIGDLTKTEVRELARHLGIPHSIVDKTPTAGLWRGQTDESEMGLTYEQLDKIICGMKMSPTALRRVRELHGTSAHKRVLPPVCLK